MGDIDDLQSLTTLTNNLQSIEPNITSSSNSRGLKAGGINSESLSNALKKAVNVFNQDDTKKMKSTKKDLSKKFKNSNLNENEKLSQKNEENDVVDDDLTNNYSSKRRRVPELDATSKKSKYEQTNKHNGNVENILTNSHPASYDIMSTRSLKLQQHRKVKKNSRNS